VVCRRASSELEVAVSETRSTGSLAAPDLTGETAGFSYATGLIGLIPRDEAAAKIWDQWANLGAAAAAEVSIPASSRPPRSLKRPRALPFG
jgi:hypothetical protein